MPLRRPSLLVLLILGFLPFAASSAPWERLFAPDAELWEIWTPYTPDSGARVDHGDWEALLKAHLVRGPNGVMRADYAGFARDRAVLDGYVARLAATEVRDLDRPDQFAYWINLYNALTVRVVLDHPEVESIRDIDISPGLFASGPWGAELVTVQGQPLTLNDIEHRILRPIFADPRIHYAVNCASIGCPDLRPEAYESDRLETQLDDQASRYVNHSRGARIDSEGGLHVSSVYVWFREDFGGTEKGVIEHMLRYAEGTLRNHLITTSEIAGDAYDWQLNGIVLDKTD
ncbi:MAG: DUF547 domain-containing protein [Minwuia sp.]|nr:DUF547 domain-containing protein [Minwuia sp.]